MWDPTDSFCQSSLPPPFESFQFRAVSSSTPSPFRMGEGWGGLTQIPEDRKDSKKMAFQDCYATWYWLCANNNHQAKERSSGKIIWEYRRSIQVIFLRCGSQSIAKSQHPGEASEDTNQACSTSACRHQTTRTRSSGYGSTTARSETADCRTSNRKRSAEERTRQAAG